MQSTLVKFIFTVCLFLTSTITLSAEPSTNNIPTYSEDQLTISVTPNQPQFSVRLKSNPTTGYSWFLRKYASKLLTPVKHHFEVSKTKLIGAPGVEVWTFRVKPEAFVVPQQTRIQFVYARPWEKSGDTTKLVFVVTTHAK
jgi:inhibitor of cysteine peptidase